MTLTTGNETANLSTATADFFMSIFGLKREAIVYPKVPIVPSPFDPIPSESKPKAEFKDEKATGAAADKNGFVSVKPTGEADIEFVKEVVLGNGRVETLTRFDLAALKDAALDMDKARAVKPFFAAEKSTETAAKEIKARGFGQRTLDDYWAAFHTGEAESQKSTRKSPQN